MSELMKQAHRIQEKMLKLKEDLAGREVEASSGGGMVTAVANGNGDIKAVRIDSGIIKVEEKEMLEDLVVAAVNAAIAKAGELAQAEQQKITGGINIPGLF